MLFTGLLPVVFGFYSSPVRNDSREFPGKAKFPGNLGKFCVLLVRPKIPENSREFLGTPPAVFNSFSRILENSQDLTEMCENQILNSFKRTGSQEFLRIPRNDLTFRF